MKAEQTSRHDWLKTAASWLAQIAGGLTLDGIRTRLGHGRDDTSFVALCALAVAVAAVFLGVLLFDAYKQWKLRAPLRAALKDAKRRAKLSAERHEPPADPKA